MTEQSSGEGFHTLLESAKGLFLWDRFLAIGISTLVDLKHLAGLTTLWEYRDLLGVGMGIFRFGRNWAFMTTFLYRVRKEEEGTLGTVLSHRKSSTLCAPTQTLNTFFCPKAFSRAGLYRDKYRSLNDTLWRTKASKSVKMVDLDSDAEEGPSKPTPVAPAKGKLFTPKEVIRARAANLLNLPRFR